MPDYETILYERRGSVVYITLNRPEVLNALNDQMAEDLRDAWHQFDADPEAFVAILSGAGRAFCSGADVKQRQLRPREELVRFGGPGGGRSRGGGLMDTVNWKPVIAVVHGYVYGAGLSTLALQADLIVAAEGTKCQFTEVRRGLMGATQWQRARFATGDRFANELGITGRVFTAEEAYQHGMINRVVPADRIMETAEELAAEILKNPPLSVRSAVRMARWEQSEAARLSHMYEQGLRLYLSEDFHEAASAFMEKREPNFKGR